MFLSHVVGMPYLCSHRWLSGWLVKVYTQCLLLEYSVNFTSRISIANQCSLIGCLSSFHLSLSNNLSGLYINVFNTELFWEGWWWKTAFMYLLVCRFSRVCQPPKAKTPPFQSNTRRFPYTYTLLPQTNNHSMAYQILNPHHPPQTNIY